MLDLIFGYNGLGRVEGNGGYVPGGGTSAAGGVFGGQPGPLRLLSDALASQIAWLAPLVVVGGIAAIVRHRRRPVRLAMVVLWALWLVVVGYVFTNAMGTFHAYYTALMGPRSPRSSASAWSRSSPWYVGNRCGGSPSGSPSPAPWCCRWSSADAIPTSTAGHVVC